MQQSGQDWVHIDEHSKLSGGGGLHRQESSYSTLKIQTRRSPSYTRPIVPRADESKKMEMEQLNILNDLVGRLHETESKAMSNIVVTKEQDNSIGSMFSWFDILKIMGLSTIGFILFLISIRLFIACNIIPKIAKIGVSFAGLFHAQIMFDFFITFP